MCGIAGFVDLMARTGPERLAAVATSMASSLEHRGPDDQGVWVDAPAGVALGHRRLAIIDLSAEGHQPMESPDGRWVVAFNGEIYNFPGLRRELESVGWRFRGHCDTEVLLAAVCQWGVERAVERCNGMFAVALWDRAERRLWLLRDRMGEKPLYYGRWGNLFLFASELKALRRHPSFSPIVDRESLALYFQYGYVPGPRSIYREIRKLAPGWLAHLDVESAEIRTRPYWSAKEVAERSADRPVDARALVDEFAELLGDAVAIRTLADVPLGAFLSGGVDSSTVVALMQARSSRPVKTFTIGFRESAYDEAGHARQVARHLGTEHTELYVTPEDAMAVVPKLPELYDEPFADSSQIPTYLVSRLARQHVTVALSGDGGDELFHGYDRYRWTSRIWNLCRAVPLFARRAVARALLRRTAEDWDRLAARLPWRVPARLGERLHRLTGLLDAGDPLELYVRLMSHWGPDGLVIGGPTPTTRLTDPAERAAVPRFVDQLAFLDGITYLPDDILTKVDRASMAVSLEARVPFLDPRVVEFAWRIPARLKSHQGKTKWPVRQLLYRHVPERLIERPKMGFGVPVGSWLRGPLRDWTESLLAERSLRSAGYLEAGPVLELWRRHLDGHEAGHLLWDVLMFQSWLAHAEP